jgi:parvulin-like peptidyl-prolyl isomerase
VSALIASVAADAEFEEPDEAALRRFHAEHPGRFTRSERLSLEVGFVSARARPDPIARRIAGEIARRVRAGEDFERVRAERADAPVAELPGGALPIETVRRYLGPTAARTALELEVGEVSEPVRGSAGYQVLRLRERAAGKLAPFAEVREQVRAELLRRRGEQALGDYLGDLRASAEIRVREPEPAS